MRSAIDARGSTIAATVALLAGISLIAGSLFRAGRSAPTVQVSSLLVPARVETHDVEQSAVRRVVVRDLQPRPRAAAVRFRFPSANSGVPEGIGTTSLEDLALPSSAPPLMTAPPVPQPETSDGLATAAAEFADGLAHGSQKTGARTAAFFKRFGKKVATSFGR